MLPKAAGQISFFKTEVTILLAEGRYCTLLEKKKSYYTQRDGTTGRLRMWIPAASGEQNTAEFFLCSPSLDFKVVSWEQMHSLQSLKWHVNLDNMFSISQRKNTSI